jgi:hypothetical protein
VDTEGCVVTITADAPNAGTAVVRVTGPGVDRSFLMAIADGVAQIEVPFGPGTAGEYRFDVTTTGVSSTVTSSRTESVDCGA